MTAPDITLEKAKQTIGVREHRVSDFLTQEQNEEVRQTNAKGKKGANFDKIDAYVAEIIARFGYQAYIAWKNGDIHEAQMAKLVEAERVRDIREMLSLKSIIIASVAGANNPNKSGHMPKSLKAAINILKKEQKIAEGGK